MRPRTLLLWLLGIASIPFVLIMLIVVFAQLNDLQLRIRGYHVMSAGWELGEILAAQGGSANECLKFRSPTFDIMTPSKGEHVGMCVRKYAELKKDPSACELLMPSSYGLSCVGGAEDFDLPCGTEKYTVYWNENNVPHEATLRECHSSNRNISELGQQCCMVARTRYMLSENDCSAVRDNVPVYDRCLYGLAWKNKDPKLCNEITNANAKAGCAVQAAALQKDPSLCAECTKPLNNLSDLK